MTALLAPWESIPITMMSAYIAKPPVSPVVNNCVAKIIRFN